MAKKEGTLALRAFLDKTGFGKALNEMKADMGKAGKEFEVTSSGVKAFGSDLDVLETRQKYLSETIQKQKSYLELQAQAFAKSKDEMGADSKITEELGEQVRKGTVYWNNLQSELRNVTGKIDDHRRAMGEAQAAEARQAQSSDKSASSMKNFMEAAGRTDAMNRLNEELDESDRKYQLTASAARAYGSKLDELRAKQKYLNSAEQTQRSIVNQLSEAYEKAKTDTGHDSTATKELAVELNKAKVSYNNLQGEIRDTNEDIKTETVSKKKSADGWTDWIKGAVLGGITGGSVGSILSGVFSSIGSGLSNIGNLAGNAFGALRSGAQMTLGFVQTVASGVQTLASGIKNIVMNSSHLADETAEMAVRMGLTTQQVQELQYAAELVDTDVDTMAGSISKLTVNMGKAKDQQDAYTAKQDEAKKKHKEFTGELGDQAQAFKTLNVFLKDTHGNLRDANDVWYQAITALGKVRNETERDELANTLFGKSYQDLKPIIDAGTDKLKELAEEAHKAGYVLSDEQIAKLGALDDAFQRLKKTGETVEETIGIAFAPGLTKFFDTISENAPAIMEELVPAFTEMGDAAGDLLSGVLGSVDWKQVGNDGARLISTLAGDMREATPYVERLAEKAPDLLQGIADALDSMPPGIIDKLGNFAVNGFSALADDIKQATPYVERMVEKAPGLLQGIADALDNMPDGTIDKFGNLAVNGFSALADAAVECAPSLVDIIETVAQNSDSLSAAISNLADKSPEIADSLSLLAKDAIPSIASSLPTITESLGTFLDDLIKIGDWVANNRWVLYALAPFTGGATLGVAGLGGSSDGQSGGGAYAAGGYASGGISLVGENGPELTILPRGAHVFNASETKTMLNGQGPREVRVTGTIRLEGTDRKGIIQEAQDVIMERLYAEARMI